MATMWKRTLVALGLAEDYDDEYADLPPEQSGPRGPRAVAPPPEAPPRPEHSNVRPIPTPRRPEPVAAPGSLRPLTSAKVHVTTPTTFNDVEEVGEAFRSGTPVIMNLAGATESVAKRLLDFASGLIFGLDGRIERVGDRVFLLTPAGVDVSSEERRKLTERGFFNQA